MFYKFICECKIYGSIFFRMWNINLCKTPLFRTRKHPFPWIFMVFVCLPKHNHFYSDCTISLVFTAKKSICARCDRICSWFHCKKKNKWRREKEFNSSHQTCSVYCRHSTTYLRNSAILILSSYAKHDKFYVLLKIEHYYRNCW